MRLLMRCIRPQHDDGFTLAELIVSMMIIAVILLSLVGLQVNALVTTTQAKQRQQATALGNQVLEQLRSLPYSLLSLGGSSAAPADPNVTAGVLTLNGLNEPVVANNTGTDAPPLASTTTYNRVQQTDQASSSVTYDARSYVSRPSGAAVTSPLNLTVVVSWSSSATRGVLKQESFRSTAFAPVGCLSLTSRPFSGPCQAFLYADATLRSGAVTVERSAGLDLVGATGVRSLSLPLLSGGAGIDVEQNTGVNAVALTSGAVTNDVTGAVVARSGQVQFRTLAGNDPASIATAPVTDTDTATQSASAQTVDGLTALLTATPAPTETGSLISTVSSPAACVDLSATAVVNQPCSNTTLRQTSDATVAVDYKAVSLRNLPATTVASIGTAGTSSVAWAGRYITAAGAARCTSVSAAGCISAGTKRSMGTVLVGAVPAGVAGDTVPILPDGIVKLTGYADQLINESGTTSNAVAQVTSRTGALSYVRADGVAQTPTLTNATSIADTLLPRTASYATLSGIPLVLTVTGTVTVTPVVLNSLVPDALCAVACVKQATMPSVLVNLTYRLSQGGIALDTFHVKVDPGSSYATTTYKAAPSA